MQSMDLSTLIGKPQEQQTQEQQAPQLSKEEYAALKKSERESVWARVDSHTEEVFKDGQSLQGLLDFAARCTPQSTRNLLILHEQNPEIRHPRTFEKWQEAGRSVRSGETGYTFFAEQEYERDDGTTASGYTLTKAFDISQTRGPQPVAAPQYQPEELLAAMVEQSPARLEISDQLPQGVQAQYVPGQRTIYVRNDMDENATFCAIAREQAHAGFDSVGRGYFRQAFAAQAYCAAYVVAQKFGVDTGVFHFDKVREACKNLSTQDKRGFLGDVKAAAYSINRAVQRSFRDMEQSIAADGFSVEGAKPAKAAKSKAEKKPER